MKLSRKFRFRCKEVCFRILPLLFCCHRRADRSFFYKGRQFPICARCTGVLSGLLLSPALFFFPLPGIRLSLLLMLPLIFDGLLQNIFRKESTNGRRFVTGLFFGIGTASLFGLTTIMAFQYGIKAGLSMKH